MLKARQTEWRSPKIDRAQCRRAWGWWKHWPHLLLGELVRPAIYPAPEGIACTIPPLPDGWQPVTFTILRDGDLAILGTDVDLRHEWRRDEKGMPIGNPRDIAARASARIWTFDGLALVAAVSFPLLWPFPCFDKFPDGRWLVTNSRADQEPLGRILDCDGHETGRIQLGDGIEHLKIDDSGRIWVGWFDEGVFGNDSWRVPNEEWPPSSYGLAAFDDEGTMVAHADGGPIDDCYALNVISDTAWACAYASFEIIACNQLQGSRRWPSGLKGPSALAVEGNLVLAAGGYSENGNKAVLLRLDEHQSSIVGEWRLPFPTGGPRPFGLIDGRGNKIHVVRDGFWHRWSVADFMSTLTR